MAAPPKNEFWKNRSSHGRPRAYSDADELLKDCNEYFQWSTDNPLHVAEVIKSGNKAGSMFQVPTPRPFTYQALCIFLGIESRTFQKMRRRSEEEKDDDFIRVFDYVDDVIRTQKFEYATIGVFNGNIIARELGLVDKREERVDVTSNGEAITMADVYEAKRAKQDQSESA